MSDMPSGWTETRFEAVADIQLGKMLDKAKNLGDPTPYLRNINVRWGEVDTSNILTMPMSADERTKFSIRDGDVLVCEGGEPGRAAVWRSGATDLKFQKAILRVRPAEGVSPDWLARYLRLTARDGALEERFTGTTIKHLPREALQDTPLPLPPKEEQRRIVAKIDSLSVKSKRVRNRLDHVPRLVEKYKQAVLGKVFSTQPGSGWQTCALEDVLADALIGLVRSRSEQSLDGGTPYIRMNHYNLNGQWNFDDLTHVAVNPQEQLRYLLEEGDVLFNTRNSYELVGKVAIWSQQSFEAVFNNNILRLRFKPQIDPKFAFYQFLAPDFRSYLDLSKSATTSVCAIYQRSVMAAPFAFPCAEQQRDIVHRIETAFVWIDRLIAEATSARKLIDQLDQAVLAKAFRGELVPQDPADEPASVLLDRICAEKDQAAAAKPRRGRPRLAIFS